MKVLITGGLGFIGRGLAQNLAARDDVMGVTLLDTLSPQVHGESPDYRYITDNPKVNFIKGSVCDPDAVTQALEGVDLVYHLACETGTGQSMYEIQRYFDTNVLGTACLLETMVKNPDLRPDRVVLSSSRSVYGEGAYVRKGEENDPTAQRFYPTARDEDDMKNGQFEFTDDEQHQLVPVPTSAADPVTPNSLYAVSKLTQEQMCQVACKSIGVKFVTLRFQNVFGPGQSLGNPYTGIISIFINLLRQNKAINIFEDGEESRDFIFVDDIVRACVSAGTIEIEDDQVIDVGSGKPVSVTALVEILEKHFDQVGSAYISGDFRKGDIRHCYADTANLEKHLGLQCETDLAEGLAKTINWALGVGVEEDKSQSAMDEMKKFLG